MYKIGWFGNFADFENKLNTLQEQKLHSWNIDPQGNIVALFEDALVPPRREPAATAQVIKFPIPGGCVSIPNRTLSEQLEAELEPRPEVGKYHVG